MIQFILSAVVIYFVVSFVVYCFSYPDDWDEAIKKGEESRKG